MTTEELNQYDALSEEEKMLYKRTKSKNPDWKHTQIMLYVKIIQTYDSPLGGRVEPGVEILWDKIKNIFR